MSLVIGEYAYCAFQVDTSQQVWYSYIYIKFEVFITLYVAVEIVQNAFFFTMFTYFAMIIYTGNTLDGIKSMWNLIYQCRRNCVYSKPFISIAGRKIVDRQLHDYVEITSLALIGSRDLFGIILYNFVITNIPVNIYILRRNLFEDPEPVERFMLWVIMYLQILSAFIVFGLLSYGSAVYHKPAKFIPVLQLMMKRSRCWLWYKIKFDDLHFRLLNGPKIGVAVGPVHTVTYRTSLEVYLIIDNVDFTFVI